MSRPSNSPCVVVTGRGDALTYDGTAWSEPTTVAPLGGPDLPFDDLLVSCPTGRLGMAAGYLGAAVAYTKAG